MDTTQLLKGVLDAAVLAVIEHDDGYGYDVVRRLRAAGIDEVGDASVYGTLRRLYAAGALSTYVVPSDGGPHRKYYSMTPQGRTMLAEQRSAWAAFADTLTRLLAEGVLLSEPAGAAITDAASSSRTAARTGPTATAASGGTTASKSTDFADHAGDTNLIGGKK